MLYDYTCSSNGPFRVTHSLITSALCCFWYLSAHSSLAYVKTLSLTCTHAQDSLRGSGLTGRWSVAMPSPASGYNLGCSARPGEPVTLITTR